MCLRTRGKFKHRRVYQCIFVIFGQLPTLVGYPTLILNFGPFICELVICELVEWVICELVEWVICELVEWVICELMEWVICELVKWVSLLCDDIYLVA